MNITDESIDRVVRGSSYHDIVGNVPMRSSEGVVSRMETLGSATLRSRTVEEH